MYMNPPVWNITVDGDEAVQEMWYPTAVNPSFPASVVVANLLTSVPDPVGEVTIQDNKIQIGDIGEAMVVFCKHTILDVSFAYVNSTYSIINTSVSDQNVANITNIPIILGYLRDYFDSQIDAIMSSNRQSSVEKYARTYSQASMAILGGVVIPQPVTSAQVRRQVLVAEVQKAPLYTLVSLNLLYAVAGLSMTILALRSVRGNRDVIDVQARLGTSGLVAECFEDDKVLDRQVDSSAHLFAERSGRGGGKAVKAKAKVGVRRSSIGGWRLMRFSVKNAKESTTGLRRHDKKV